MSDEGESTPDAIREHANLLADNLIHLKRFLKAQQDEQQQFLRSLQASNDRIQRKAVNAAVAAAAAAFFAAVAAGAQAYAGLNPVVPGRYQSAPNPAGHGVYVLDTKTGELRLCMTGETKGPGTIGIACMSPSARLPNP